MLGDPNERLPACECGNQPAEGEALLFNLPEFDADRMAYECPVCGESVPFGVMKFGSEVDELVQWFREEARPVDVDVPPGQANFLSQFIPDEDA